MQEIEFLYLLHKFSSYSEQASEYEGKNVRIYEN